MRTRMLVIVVAAPALLACSMLAVHSIDPPSISDCSAGRETCVVSGELRLHQGQAAWAALVVVGDQCSKLALPDDFFVEAKRWNGSVVEVRGQAFQQPAFNDSSGIVMFWYTERDRKLSLGMCDGGVGVYVHSMRSKNGHSWPSDKR